MINLHFPGTLRAVKGTGTRVDQAVRFAPWPMGRLMGRFLDSRVTRGASHGPPLPMAWQYRGLGQPQILLLVPGPEALFSLRCLAFDVT